MGMTQSENPLAADLDHVLDHTRDLWEELRGERIFITGGTGFFGCWLLESLLWAQDRLDLGLQAVALTRDPDAFRRKAPHLAGHPCVTLLAGDVRTYPFPGGTFSHFIHAATDSSARLNEQDPLRMLDTIVEGTRHALDHAATCGAKRFLLTSSGAVYGKQPPEMTHIPEEYTGAPDPLDPWSAYGEGKRLAEHLCTLYARGSNLEPKIARCFSFVGPYLPLDIHYAIGNFIRDALHGGPIVVQGDGTPYRSYLYAADLAIWLWTILLRGGTCRPYNVGSDLGISVGDVATLVRDAVCPKQEVVVRLEPARGKQAEMYVPEVRRARQELALRDWIPLSVAIASTARWHRV
jgi:nucleoside-diphosphate-sugar epimerase